MKKVTIGICICLFFILLLLIASLLTLRKVCVSLRSNRAPYMYLPIFLSAALASRFYNDFDTVFLVEYDMTSYYSACWVQIVQALPNLFVALALYLNLAMWLDFVACSYYSVKLKHKTYLRFR